MYIGLFFVYVIGLNIKIKLHFLVVLYKFKGYVPIPISRLDEFKPSADYRVLLLFTFEIQCSISNQNVLVCLHSKKKHVYWSLFVHVIGPDIKITLHCLIALYSF